MVVRIMVMVPLYAVSSLISLFSLEAAFFIDAIRDIYEVILHSFHGVVYSRYFWQAFVIYCFFVLLLDYLGGERSLLILLHGRQPISAVFPVNLWRNEIDPSDPYIFLFLKRGILRMVVTLYSTFLLLTFDHKQNTCRSNPSLHSRVSS